MPRKVFMSVLGTGFYNECTYSGVKNTTTRFVQRAALEEIDAKSWGKDDTVYIFVTERSRKDNWQRVSSKRYNNRTEQDEEYGDLYHSIIELGLTCPVKDVDIKNGNDETEIWDIFETVYGLIEPGDELYLDLTHGFRSLPMLLLVLVNYAKFLRNVKVAYLSYGNFEAAKDGVAPIINLLPFTYLQDWTTAASSFEETGRVEVLNQAIKKSAEGISDKKHKTHLSSLMNKLKAFQQQMETCRGREINEGKAADGIRGFVDIVQQDNSLPAPTSPILQSIKDLVQSFASDSIRNIPEALQWCKKFGLVQQGYTLCQEGIVTKVCEELSEFNPFSGDKPVKKYRDYWSAILGLKDNEAVDESKWHGSLSTNRELTRSILALDWVGRLRGKYNKLTSNRNTVNHGGFTGKITAETIVNQFEGIVKDCQECFDWELTPPTASKAADRPGIFINLSNHPADKWSEAQREAARQYGELQEIPFPNVEPEADAKALKKIVEETLSQVKEAAEGKTATVHVMGEMTLTYELVSKLKEVGIRCVASTTKRDVTENADGTRTCKFNFVKFREY